MVLENGGAHGRDVIALVNQGALSLAFLDAPVMDLPDRLDRSYEQLAADRGVPMSFLRALHPSLGFAAPEPGDRAGEDDATMLEVTALFRGAGVGDDATLRLLAVYADSVRRVAKAEADYYEANIERRRSKRAYKYRALERSSWAWPGWPANWWPGAPISIGKSPAWRASCRS